VPRTSSGTRAGCVHPSRTPTFLTPLAERPVTRVTPEEKQAYEAFRRTFQDRWHAFFDPIALRLSFADEARRGPDRDAARRRATTASSTT
jgi:hypothetical protein